MQLDSDAFARLRRLAPVLDDVLNAREVEHADQAVDLQSLADLCGQLFEAYERLHSLAIARARREASEPL